MTKGYNHWSYDLTLEADQLNAFKKATGQDLKVRDQAQIFLPKGAYTFEVSIGEQMRSVPLNIE